MLLVIDTANAEDIKELVDYFPIDGVTTNPSIIVKEKKNFLDVLEDIRETIGNDRELFVQTLALKAEEIVEEARYVLEKVPGKTVIKIPATAEGIKAIKALTSLGIRTMATTIYTPLQGYVAAKAGASYLTPYVNRIDNLPGNGVQVVRDLVQIVEKHKFDSQVLAASFKNIQQVLDVCVGGAHGVTLSPDLIKQLLSHPSTESNVSAFSDDWHEAFDERTLIDLSDVKI
ncbi:transaldolase [Bacillus freudenreichii]|nr:transaldolase [Bacillus freudenreichii]